MLYGKAIAALALSAWCLKAGGANPPADVAEDLESRGSAHMHSFPLISNTARTSVGCWFWSDPEFTGDGIEAFLDACEKHTPFGLITQSIRYPVEITDPAVKERLSGAVRDAAGRGIGVALDLDIRLARAAFFSEYPDDMQEIVLVRTAAVTEAGATELRITCQDFGDHYTYRARPYGSLGGRLLRAYAYELSPDGVEPETLQDVTAHCQFRELERNECVVALPEGVVHEFQTFCALVAFRLFAPDVFSPYLCHFERRLIMSYADTPLAGVSKDEWGFPGRAEPSPLDLWYSSHMARAYGSKSGGRDLADDLLLMAVGVRGAESGRAAAINSYMEMNRERNSEIEQRFYESVKDVLGEDAFVGNHPTWFPYPGKQEAFKNGLDWWSVRRDIAQTDEVTPYAARTALAKKWGSPFWLNMYYAPTLEDYGSDIWRHLLGGGRMNFHPVWPAPWRSLGTSLLEGPLLQAEQRIRLLDLITDAPVDCPVAVVFGHPSFLNWAGEGFGDAGMALVDALWERGIYADLIPTSEVHSGALRIADDGRLCYGRQRYEAAVLYHPEYERAGLAKLWGDVAEAKATALYRVGDWTRTFDGAPFDGGGALPEAMQPLDMDGCVRRIEELLAARGIERQTPGSPRTTAGFPASVAPEPRGQCRLLDGTLVIASGAEDVRGDRITKTLEAGGCVIDVDAIGMAAVRVDPGGRVEALACGGLRRFKAGELAIELDEPLDLALWRGPGGAWKGAVLALGGALPAALTDLTDDWQRIQRIAPRQ